MKNYGVCYTGPFLDASGYGEATRNAIRALQEAGVNLKTEKVNFTGTNHYRNENSILAEELSNRNVDYNIKILHVTPDLYKNYKEANAYNIGHLFWETDKLPSYWVAGCNLMDEIWTGTKVNAKAISDSGVTVPIHIFPQAIDTVVPSVTSFNLPNTNEYTFVFYSIFEWNERKNPRALLDAYWKEFKGFDDVILLLKTHQNYSPFGVKKIVDELKGWKNSLGYKDAPRVLVSTDILSAEDIHRFHKTGDVFVSTHRGEGWGLPQVEASLHNNPIISTGFGGIHEYLTTKHYHKVGFDMVEVDKVYNKYYEPGMKWADAHGDDVRRHMRSLYNYWVSGNKRGLVKKRSREAKRFITGILNYETVGSLMKKRLDSIAKGLK